MSDARSQILKRLHQVRPAQPPTLLTDREAEWQALQPPPRDLKALFVENLEHVGSKVLRVPDWQALPAAVLPWFKEYRIQSAITGTEARLEPLRKALVQQARVKLHTYAETMEAQKEVLFSVDCGITTSSGGLADTGSVILQPSSAEPRLLSLAPPVHLVTVEVDSLFPTMGAYLDTGAFARDTPSNLVFISGPSRTADIELTLAVGVHGPGTFLVALIG